jgi:hypothetical protein
MRRPSYGVFGDEWRAVSTRCLQMVGADRAPALPSVAPVMVNPAKVGPRKIPRASQGKADTG